MRSVTCDRVDILIDSFGYEIENCGNMGESLWNVGQTQWAQER